MKYLYIAEKPDVMRQVRAVYSRHRQEILARIGEIDFMALAGHVCRYLDPDEYPKWKDHKWYETEFPMIPESFAITKGKDKYSQKILSDIKEAVKNNHYDGIIVGTDSDTEGNGIYYLVSKYLHLENYKTLRFFERSLTEQEVLDSLYNMTDFYRNGRDVRMTECFIIRSEFDWLVGMNATRIVSVKCGELYRIGRVKAPTLKLVYDNSKAIDEFKPHSDYLVRAAYAEGFTGFYCDEAGNSVSYETPKKAEAFIQVLKDGGTATASVQSVERKTKKTPAPQLYKLSQLQAEAGSFYNLTPDRTLDLVQSLYEKQLVSYPRTDGVCISSEKAKTLPKLLDTVSACPTLKAKLPPTTPAIIQKIQSDKRIVNDEEVQKASHDALLPTENIPDFSKLPEDEQKIYDLICRRLAAQMFPEMQEQKTVLMTEVAAPGDENEGVPYLFKSTGSTVTEKGWSVLYNRKQTAENIPDNIKKGSCLNISSFSVHEKKSSPPKRLSQSSLVTAMENIAKYIDEKDLKKIMREARGLGTQATRGKIIKDLIDSGYMESKTKANLLYITDMGKRYIESLNGFSITDPTQAAKWESMFQGVKNGIVAFPDAKKEMLKYTHDFVKEVESITASTRVQSPAQTQETTGLKCPWCGKDIVKFKWGYACKDSRNGCGFSVSGCDGKVKDTDIKVLVTKGITRTIPNVCKSSKTGKTYDARIKLCPKGSTHSTSFVF